jgi:hypothetical protein
MEKVQSLLNSSFVLLLANNTFTGIIEKVSIYESVTITIKSNAPSIADGIKIYLGSSPTSLIAKYTYTYTENENKTISLKLTDAYFKIEYINSNVEQTSFSLQVFYSNVLPQGNLTITDPIDVKLQDGSGNGITSTDTALDVNIKSGTLNIFDSSKYDLFGNLKTSNSFTLLDIDHIYDKNSLLMDEYVSAGASSVYKTNDASVLMSVSADTHKVIRQSRLYTTYQPGKSLCIRMTGVLNANTNGNANNTTSRIGYFDDKNGLFFQYSGGVYSIVKRKTNSNGTVTDTLRIRDNWNDRLNGSDASGVTVDFTKNIIYFIEFAFLGVGIVKFGVVYKGTLIIAYTFEHEDLTYPYISTPNLPLRWEISSSGGSGELICTCGSVQSEGGYNITGSPFSIGHKISSLQVTGSNETYVLSIKLKPQSRKLVKLISLSLICTTGTNAVYSLYKIRSPTVNPISDSSAGTEITNSVVKYHINTSYDVTIDKTNAELLYSNYFTSNESLNLTNLSNIGGPIYLTAGINESNNDAGFHSDYLVLTVIRLSNQNEKFYGAFNWIEI